MQIEARPYEANMSDAERVAVAARVTLVDRGIIIWRELPICTPDSIATMWDESQRLLAGHRPCAFIFDLRETQLPSARTREALRGYGRRVMSDSVHVSAVVANLVVGVVARLIAYASGREKTKFYPTVDAAIEEARRVLAS